MYRSCAWAGRNPGKEASRIASRMTRRPVSKVDMAGAKQGKLYVAERLPECSWLALHGSRGSGSGRIIGGHGRGERLPGVVHRRDRVLPILHTVNHVVDQWRCRRAERRLRIALECPVGRAGAEYRAAGVAKPLIHDLTPGSDDLKP